MTVGDTSPIGLESLDMARFDASSTERPHSALRSILAAHFHVNRRNWNIVALCRQRITIGPGENRVCDVCVIEADAQVERVVQSPPMICLDIIAEEPLALLQHRVDSYERLGVKHIWLLDPNFRTAWKASANGLFQIKNDEMGIPGTSIGFRLNAVFSEMDELLRPARRMSVPAALERSKSQSGQPVQPAYTERNRRDDR